MKKKQENVAISRVRYRFRGDNVIAGVSVVGAHKKTDLKMAQTYCQRGAAGVLQSGTSAPKNAANWVFTATKAWTKGQIAHLDTPFPTDRESRHGIIRSHRIRFALPSESLGINVRVCGAWHCQSAASEEDVSFKRLNMGSRRTGDQNASFV